MFRKDLSVNSPCNVILVSSCLLLAPVCYNKYDVDYITLGADRDTLPSNHQIWLRPFFSAIIFSNAFIPYVHLLCFIILAN